MTDRYFIKLSSNGETERIYDTGSSYTLKTLQDAVCGSIETVGSTLGEAVIIIVNEEGKLEGLQLNRVATSFAVIRSWDYIAGDAVFAIKSGEEIVGFLESDAEMIAKFVTVWSSVMKLFNHCPECGAKMDLRCRCCTTKKAAGTEERG